MDEFLSWIQEKYSNIILSYYKTGKDYTKDIIYKIDFLHIDSKSTFNLVLSSSKKENEKELRIIRKALLELNDCNIFLFNLKDFLNFIPGNFDLISKIYDLQLFLSLERKDQDELFFEKELSCEEIKSLISKIHINELYDILISTSLNFSKMEKSFLPSGGKKLFSYYKIYGTVSGRMTNEHLSDNFINVLNHPRNERNIIKAPQDYKIINVDYNAMEMRVLGFLSQDDCLNYIFDNDKDIYIVIGQFILGKADIDEDTRQMIKELCFLIIYGGTKYGFSSKMNISLEDAENLIQKFMESFPKVEEWILKTQIDILEKGYTESLTGRKRILNLENQEAACRQGQNFKIQSLANDVMLMAINELNDNLLSNSKIILNVFDSLCILSPENSVNGNIEIIRDIMEKPKKLQEFGIDMKLKPVFNISDFWE